MLDIGVVVDWDYLYMRFSHIDLSFMSTYVHRFHRWDKKTMILYVIDYWVGQ